VTWGEIAVSDQPSAVSFSGTNAFLKKLEKIRVSSKKLSAISFQL
jgi:hypothetical protein